MLIKNQRPPWHVPNQQPSATRVVDRKLSLAVAVGYHEQLSQSNAYLCLSEIHTTKVAYQSAYTAWQTAKQSIKDSQGDTFNEATYCVSNPAPVLQKHRAYCFKPGS